MQKVVKNYPFLTNENSNISQVQSVENVLITAHQRLKNKLRIEQVLQQGLLFSFTHFTAYWLLDNTSTGLVELHVGVVAPKKKYPLAVQRNRCKRLMREAWHLSLKDKKIHFSYAVKIEILLLGRGNRTATLLDYKGDVEKLLSKIQKKIT